MINLVAAVLLLGVVAYAVFGGADFGAGFWDLVAGGADKGRQPRSVIERAIAPVWEANHVWLIFILVVLWTGFSEAFASIMLTLFVPLTIAALGIVLRGSGFAFRKSARTTRYQRIFGGAFAIPSLIVPFCMGAVVGAIASGRVPAGGVAGDPWDSWMNPTSILGGVLAVTVAAYLATVYMTLDAHRLADDSMVEYFRRRAVVTAVIAGIVAFVGIFVLRSDARYVYDGLVTRALPVVIVSGLLGTVSLILLVRKTHLAVGRITAVGAVATIVIAWGVAQWDYLLPESLTIEDAAAPSGTLGALVVAVILAVIILGPSFFWLYRLDQQGLLPGEGVPDDRTGSVVTDG
jgi:cytochrome bd ubiquinol oxidase subunit II